MTNAQNIQNPSLKKLTLTHVKAGKPDSDGDWLSMEKASLKGRNTAQLNGDAQRVMLGYVRIRQGATIHEKLAAKAKSKRAANRHARIAAKLDKLGDAQKHVLEQVVRMAIEKATDAPK